MTHNDFFAENFYAQLKRTIELLNEYKSTLIITKSDKQRLTAKELQEIQTRVHICCVPDSYLDKGTALLTPPEALANWYKPTGDYYDGTNL